MKLKLDKNYVEFVYVAELGRFINATRDRVVGLNKIIGNSSRRGACLPYAVAFNEETKTGVIVKGFNGERSLLVGYEGERISDLLLGSYYSRQFEMLSSNKDVFSLEEDSGNIREYSFPK